MARKKINKTEKYDINKSIKVTTKNINAFVLETSEQLIDAAIEKGMQWQEVSEKAIKGGLKLADNQQDIAFKALEMIKGSVIRGSRRFKSVLGN